MVSIEYIESIINRYNIAKINAHRADNNLIDFENKYSSDLNNPEVVAHIRKLEARCRKRDREYHQIECIYRKVLGIQF